MSNLNDAKKLLESLSRQLDQDRLAEMRRVSGVGYLPPGVLTDLVQDQPYSVEDIVTVLLSGWTIRSMESERSAQRISELEALCQEQQKAMDLIADQATRLRFLLNSVSPDDAHVSPIDMLKSIAARAESGSSPET